MAETTPRLPPEVYFRNVLFMELLLSNIFYRTPVAYILAVTIDFTCGFFLFGFFFLVINS